MKPRVKRLQRKKPDLYIKREDSRSSKRGRCERFVYYYIDGKFGRLPFDSRNIATQKNLSKNGFTSIATFLQQFSQFFLMDFCKTCGNPDLGQSDRRNSVIALFILTLVNINITHHMSRVLFLTCLECSRLWCCTFAKHFLFQEAA